MTRFAIAFPLLLMASAAICAAEDAYTPLELYNGGWRVQKGGAAPDTLVNHCAHTGFYYMCEQVVNGKTSALVVFVPGDAPGNYHSTVVFPSGEPRGPGDLTINGNRWVFIGKSVDGNKTTWFRTINVFTGNDHIHFEQAQSTDGTHWTTGGSGDEVRVLLP
jgi:hypothetical protein